MAEERPRVGPWLRSYGKPPRQPWRERLVTLLVGLGVALVFGALSLAVLWAFVRRPLLTLGGLILVWAVGLVILMVKRQRARLREELERRSRGGGARLSL
jgi:hypothetical protein